MLAAEVEDVEKKGCADWFSSWPQFEVLTSYIISVLKVND